MFYTKRNTIYFGLIILALFFMFLIGKNVGMASAKTISTTTQKVVPQNLETNQYYNEELKVQGDNYSLSYTIDNAYLLSNTKLTFSITLGINQNVKKLKVIAENDNNENLSIISVPSQDKNSLNYAIDFDTSVKNISIIVYPLTDAMTKNNKLDFNALPYKQTKININAIKKLMIQNLESE